MAQPEAFEACRPLLRAFEDLRIDYLVGGSLASSFHGIPRSTQDVDVVADLKPVHGPLLVSRLQELYYIELDRIQHAILSRSSFNVLYLRTMFKVDIFMLNDDPYSREEMRRRQRIEVEGEPLEIASAEDTVLQKIVWYRRGGEISDRQWLDIVGVMKVCRGKLDSEYLDRWASHLEITELLARAHDDAG